MGADGCGCGRPMLVHVLYLRIHTKRTCLTCVTVRLDYVLKIYQRIIIGSIVNTCIRLLSSLVAFRGTRYQMSIILFYSYFGVPCLYEALTLCTIEFFDKQFYVVTSFFEKKNIIQLLYIVMYLRKAFGIIEEINHVYSKLLQLLHTFTLTMLKCLI